MPNPRPVANPLSKWRYQRHGLAHLVGPLHLIRSASNLRSQSLGENDRPLVVDRKGSRIRFGAAGVKPMILLPNPVTCGACRHSLSNGLSESATTSCLLHQPSSLPLSSSSSQLRNGQEKSKRNMRVIVRASPRGPHVRASGVALLLAVLVAVAGGIAVDAVVENVEDRSTLPAEYYSSSSLAERISRALIRSQESKEGEAAKLPRSRDDQLHFRRGLVDSEREMQATYPPEAACDGGVGTGERQVETLPPYEMQSQPGVAGSLSAFVYQPKVTVVEGLPAHRGIASLSNPCTCTRRKRFGVVVVALTAPLTPSAPLLSFHASWDAVVRRGAHRLDHGTPALPRVSPVPREWSVDAQQQHAIGRARRAQRGTDRPALLRAHGREPGQPNGHHLQRGGRSWCRRRVQRALPDQPQRLHLQSAGACLAIRYGRVAGLDPAILTNRSPFLRFRFIVVKSGHGLQKYPSTRNRVAATLKNGTGVPTYVFFGTKGLPREDGKPNGMHAQLTMDRRTMFANLLHNSRLISTFL
jgi:hypothetical protein